MVGFCPEVSAALPVPRPVADIHGGDAVLAGNARASTRAGDDVSDFFVSGRVYDSSFTPNALAGSGFTAALSRRHGIAVFNQHEID